LKIGQHLAKLWAIKYGDVFMKHSMYNNNGLSISVLMAIFHVDLG